MRNTPDPAKQADEAAIAAWRRGRENAKGRGASLPTMVFAGGSLTAFLILLGCVFAAVLLYYRGH
jgi:hypothetical protein